ncbi:hypothetical protein GCM10011519_28080 [Marmoricola endophyticus]|uniref:IclR family transcriptional regulator n=1 Tax=Marmoricola endophyticus TaxID=2040280 RepID=A0A917F6H9_9ACTN|nr:helix-turn-helix domain-containing protein [Marmoricola endophyticus]GGF52498.1 hypothetical protein GCM10011519_28080 [Marmoricola endophyticus]
MTPVDGHGRRAHHRGVDRVAAILEEVARAPRGATTAELGRALGVPASTIQDLANGLVATGFLLEHQHRFRLGPALHVLTLIDGVPLPALSQDELNRLGALAGTTLLLAVRVGAQAVYVSRGGPDEVPRLSYVADEHHPRSLLRTAAGRLLVALADESERRDLVAELDLEDAEATAELVRAVPAIRASRVAHSDGAADPGVSAVAVPVTRGGRVVAALVLVGEGRGASERVRLDGAARRVLAAVDGHDHGYP